MAQSLAGRAALVTGSAGGFGRLITRGLLESGASVVAADINRVGLEALRVELAKDRLDEHCVIRELDISDCRACADTVARMCDASGGIDILVNNGAVGMGVLRADHMTNLVGIDEIEPAVWDNFVSVNLSGAWYLTKMVYPHMKAKGWGRIINVTTSFFTMLRGKFHPYGPIKAGLEAMSAGHAAEFRPDGITVNVVVPGGASDTPMVPKEAPFARSDLIPASSMVPPILWLCSDEAALVTGNRYVAAHWDSALPVDQARAASEAPIGWPDLAGTPVWPGGTPKD